MCFEIQIASTSEIVLPPPVLNCSRKKGSFIALMLSSPSINKHDPFLINNWKITNAYCLIAFCMETKRSKQRNSLDIYKGNALS